MSAHTRSEQAVRAARQWLISAKGGDEEAVVFLALLGDCDVPNGVCGPLVQNNNVWSGGEPSPRLRTLAESFTYGSWASVCAPDYSEFFQEAVSVIATACDGFNPPGDSTATGSRLDGRQGRVSALGSHV